MKKIIYSITVLAFYSSAFSQLPGIEWQKCLGGSAQDIATGGTETQDGNYIITGATKSTNGDVLNNHGQMDIWVVKLDTNGNILWKTTFGGSNNDIPNALTPTSDGGVVIIGSSESTNGDIPTPNFPGENIVAVKYDTSGNVVWKKNFEGQGWDVIQTSDGGYAIAGGIGVFIGAPINGSSTFEDAKIIKLDANANIEWENTYGTFTLTDEARSIVETADGSFVFGGTTIDGDDDLLSSDSTLNLWIVKIDALGNRLWQKSYGTTSGDVLVDLIGLSGGGYLVSGDTYGTDGDKSVSLGNHDAWILKLDEAGDIVWEKSYGGAWADTTQSLLELNDGNYVLGGRSNSQNSGDIIGFNGGNDYWIVKIDTAGTVVWETTYGGTNNETFCTFSPTSDNGYLMLGSTASNDGNVSGNHSVQTGLSATEDMWVIKLAEGPLSLNNIKNPEEYIYPNPAVNVINIPFLSTGIVEIYTIDGRKIKGIPIKDNAADISFLPTGVYVARIFDGEKIVTKKIIKE